jgi:hypothetical protein
MKLSLLTHSHLDFHHAATKPQLELHSQFRRALALYDFVLSLRIEMFATTIRLGTVRAVDEIRRLSSH